MGRMLLSIALAASVLIWPVDPHEVERAFDAPAAKWAAGHRGIDIDAAVGDIVAAPADGVVHFAGVVVDRPLVTIDIGDATLVTIEPVTPSVSVGDSVTRGQPIGSVAAAGSHACASCIHLGVRIDGEYVNPMMLLGAERSVLLPLSRAGMRQAIDLGQSLEGDVRVDLRRAEARVPENLLHRAKVRTAIQQVGSGGVPHGVGARRARTRRILEQARDQRVHPPWPEPAPTRS